MAGAPADTEPGLEALLTFLKHARGFDLTGYKRASLERRFRRRMETIGIGSFGDYLDHLEANPDEFEALFDTLLINVTEFFRDPEAWAYLREHALPGVLDGKLLGEPLRIWSAGCATGQEAYTLAMLLAEMIGDEAFVQRVKIYATDLDEEALAVARAATYSEHEMEGVSPDLRARYFEHDGARWSFRNDLRRALIFGRNNLVEDAPISRLDLLVCRNTLMYFTADTQAQILRHFHFALRRTGVLMLGRSEMLVSHRAHFAAIDLKQRIFSPLTDTSTLRARVTGMNDAEPELESPAASEDAALRAAALELSPTPQVVISRAGLLTFANVAARALFEIGADAVGSPFAELPLASTPVDLGAAVEQAIRARRPVAVGEIDLSPPRSEPRRLDVSVVPLLADSSTALGALIALEDASRAGALQAELDTHRRDLQAAYEELESTIDELETTNEELQSANEELQTTNEELQSTNEELETMNEELQSTNEELETINDELRDRTSELDQVNDFLEAILTSLGFAVVVLDRRQKVLVWNRGAEELWGVRADEAVDRSFLGLDIGLRPERFASQLRAILVGEAPEEQVVLDAVNRRGRAMACLTTIKPLLGRNGGGDGDREVQGAIVLMEEQADGLHAGSADGNGG